MILFFLTCISFALFGFDKWLAIHHRWRISENTLLLFTITFGSYGSFLGMILFHHKIRKAKFYITIPVCIFIQTLLLYILFQQKM